MTANQEILRPTFFAGSMAAGDVGHTFESAEWKAWPPKSPTSMHTGCPGTVADGSSSLYRHLRAHPHSSTHLLPAAAADVAHRLRACRETAEDGDELAEVCFRAAGRAGAATREAQLGLAAALLAHFTGQNRPAGGVTACDSCAAPAPLDRWRAAIRSCTRPAAARTVAR
jgi:hypothetical protein